MSNDLVRADCWAHMVDVRGTSNEQLKKRFDEFSIDAKLMLLKDWEKMSDDRMKEIVKILKESIG